MSRLAEFNQKQRSRQEADRRKGLDKNPDPNHKNQQTPNQEQQTPKLTGTK